MAGIVILTGPQAPADAPIGLCAVCIAVGKFMALADVKAEIEAFERTGSGVKRWPLSIPREFMQRAVTWSIVPAMQALAPVCWTHAIAIQPMSGGIIPAQGMPPGLNGGQGIPLLGGGQ